MSPENGDRNPVTLSVSRKIRTGREADYEAWVTEVIGLASAMPGYLGIDVLKPSARTGNEYVIIFRFDSFAACRAWELSPDRIAAVEKLDDMAEGDATVKKVSGLEFWFDLPEVPAAASVSRHKMALTVGAVIFALAFTVQSLFGAYLAELPLALRVFAVVVVQVTLMTYLIMPAVTRILKPWLYGGSA